MTWSAAPWGSRAKAGSTPSALMQAFQQSARASGVTYVTGEVTGILSFGGRVDAGDAVRRAGLSMRTLVNAAGPRAGAAGRFAGVDLPVVPRKRYVYSFSCKTEIHAAPLVIDPSGVYFRPDEPNYIGGFSPRDGEEDPDTLDLTVDLRRLGGAGVAGHRAPGAGLRGGEDAPGVGRPLRGQHRRPQRDHRSPPGDPEPHVRERVLGPRPPAGAGGGRGAWPSSSSTARTGPSTCRPLGYERIAENRPLRELNVV